MKKIILMAALVIGAANAQAQFPAMGASGGAKGAQQAPSIGVAYGKLVDSTGKPIADASVVLLASKMDTATKKRKEVLLKGMTTKGNGEFSFSELPIFGTPLKIKVSATGYQPYEAAVAFQMKMPAGGGAPRPGGNGGAPDMSSLSAMASNFEKDLGKVVLKTDIKQLQDVTVTATSGRLRMDIDKKVFSVDKNLVSAGGTAVDVMKNVPSLNVDIDGNVTMRNAAPTIFIDGRPTTLSLDQIPADAIESVEVITNPSAKYDASGGNAGILNIILKKNKKSGYNGMVNLGVDKRGGMNGGGSFSVRQNKINASVSAFTNQMRNRATSDNQILSTLPNPDMIIDQFGRNRTKGGFIFGRAGLDYFVNNRLTISASGTRVRGEFNPNDWLYTDSSFVTGTQKSYAERHTTGNREFNALGGQAGFKYIFPRQGEELTGDINTFRGRNENSSLFETDVFIAPGSAKMGNIRQQIQGKGTNQFTTIQLDYVRPYGKSGKLEMGARTQLRQLENKQTNYFYNAGTGVFVPIPSASTNYRNRDDVYAAYVSYGNQVKNFGYKLGLRGESSNYVGELTDTKQEFVNKYPLSLFPSLFLSQKMDKNREVQLSYTRRINRPFFMQLIPFIDSTDQLFWNRGNAGLRPEFTNSLEASYSKTYKGNNNFLASVYYKNSTDLITRFLDSITVNNEKRPINTYINANSSRSIGAEFTSQNQLKKWWDLTTNLNVYNAFINTDNVLGYSQDAIWSYFAKFNSNFKLPKNYTVQFSGTYQSKTNIAVSQGGGGFGPPGMGGGASSAAQGYIKPNYGFDLAFRKSFLKQNAASVTFSINDVFRTRVFAQHTESAFFIQDTRRRPDSPMFRINFSFRFGKMDMSLFKRKNMNAEGSSMQGAMEGM